MTHFWNNLHQVHSKSIGLYKSLGTSKPKGPKQKSQNRGRPSIPEGEELRFKNNYIIYM